MTDKTKASGDDLSAFDLDDDGGADMIVRHPGTGLPLKDEQDEPWTIRMCSAYSNRHERAVHGVQNAHLKKRKLKITAEEVDAGQVTVLAKCVLGWSGITLDGRKVEFSEKNAAMLFERFKFIREQAADFIEDQANFLTG